jgi:LmbE family N-acetylglucosaminyl deacetylase
VHQVREVYLSGTLEPNCWIDISDTLERKIDALFCHASQLVDAGEWFRQFLRERAEEAGTSAGVKFAEPFRKLTFGA